MPASMTAQTLFVIRKYLARVVAHGPEQDELLKAVEAIDRAIASLNRNRQAA